MEIKNLTPHPITFHLDNGEKRIIAPEMIAARVSTTQEKIGEIDGIPVIKTKYGKVENLPPQSNDTIYLVSSLVAQRCKERKDVFVPSESIRGQLPTT